MDWNILDVLAHLEAFQSKAESDTPGGSRSPVAIQGHDRLLGGCFGLTFAFLGLADGLGSDLWCFFLWRDFAGFLPCRSISVLGNWSFSWRLFLISICLFL